MSKKSKVLIQKVIEEKDEDPYTKVHDRLYNLRNNSNKKSKKTEDSPSLIRKEKHFVSVEH
jgi:hypothetical protein